MDRFPFDPYAVLDVPHDAGEDTIKRAYRRLARQLHPDMPDGDERRFQQVAQAYDILTDPQQRARFDRDGTGRPTTTPPPPGRDVDDLLADILNATFGSSRRRPGRGGRTVESQVTLTVPESLQPTVRTVVGVGRIRCGDCGGQGHLDGTATCRQCGGAGEQIIHDGGYVYAIPCATCSGRGQAPSGRCGPCHGTGDVSGPVEHTVQIPAGVTDGTIVRVAGAGEPGVGLPDGDLHVRIQLHPHPLWARDGADILAHVPVTWPELAAGTTFDLPDPSDTSRTLPIRVPPGSNAGDEILVSGRGAPHLRGRGRGTLRIVLELTPVGPLTRQQRHQLRDLAKQLDTSVRDELFTSATAH